MSDAFAGSPEFTQRYGVLGNVALVTLLYHNVLERDPDAGGLKASVDFLGRGACRGEVMLGFSESPEFIASPKARQLRALTVASPLNGATHSCEFGDGWIDADHDGCDTREEVLIAESLEPPVVSRIGGWAVASGRWLDPYTATTFTSPGELDIDHVVPLADAWVSGVDVVVGAADLVRERPRRGRSRRRERRGEPIEGRSESRRVEAAESRRLVRLRQGLGLGEGEVAPDGQRCGEGRGRHRCSSAVLRSHNGWVHDDLIDWDGAGSSSSPGSAS